MDENEQGDQTTREVLLNLTAAAFPIFGLMLELQERMPGRLPHIVNTAVERFQEAAVQAVLLFPENELKAKVLAMIPPGENAQAVEESEEAREKVEALFQKARTFGGRGD